MITAVDIGATKTLIAQFGDDGQPKNQTKFPTPQGTDDLLRLIFEHLETLGNIEVISVGVPGVIDNGGVVNFFGNRTWLDWPLKELLSKKYNCPVYLENDGHMGALGEINALKPLPHRGLYVTVSTGIGGGLVIDGRLPEPSPPSEFGKMMIDYEDQTRPWETFASGKALFEHFGKRAVDLTDPAAWEWLADRLSVGLLALIPEFDPDVVVFGGGVGHYFDKYEHQLRARLAEHQSVLTKDVELRPAQHPEEAVIYGCYYYATHQQAA